MIGLNPVYKDILKTDKRYIIVTGGRGSGKSFAINTLLSLLTYEKGHRILFTRYTMTSAEISIIPEFKEKIELLGVQSDFKFRNRDIENIRTHADIIFRGIKTSSGNQTAQLKSIQGVTVWVVEEAEELQDENVFDTIDLSIRAKGNKNLVILVLNPTTKTHWIYDRWFKGFLGFKDIQGKKVPISLHPDILHIHTTYLDNIKNLNETFISQIEKLKKTNLKKYIHKILGAWLEKAEGVVFENWKDGKFDETLPYCYALDYGFFPDPLAMVKLAVDRKNKKVYVKEEIYETKLSDDDLVKILSSKISKRDLLVTDTNEPRTNQRLKKERFNVVKAIKEKIADDIREMEDYELIIDPNSQNLKTELNNYVWNDKKASIPIDDFNHLLDAMRYGFRRLVGKKKKGIKKVN